MHIELCNVSIYCIPDVVKVIQCVYHLLYRQLFLQNVIFTDKRYIVSYSWLITYSSLVIYQS